MRVAVLARTDGGRKLCKKLCKLLPFEEIQLLPEEGIKSAVRRIWPKYQGIILIMAAGIVVRAIATLLDHKKKDPCVVVLDEAGTFSISLLSGHIGGGNALANEVARTIGATAVITTASDVLGQTPIDLWAKYNNLIDEDMDVTRASAILVNNSRIQVFTPLPGELPHDFRPVNTRHQAELIIDHQRNPDLKDHAYLRPKALIIGLGCNRGTSAAEIEEAVRATCLENALAFEAIDSLASIDLKSDESGLLDFADHYALSIVFYSAEELNRVEGFSPSKAVFKATGAHGVCEPAALLRAESVNLIVEKRKWKNVTVAIAVKAVTLSANFS